MSVALISFCSFLSGVGSCAAFQAALKTGSLPVISPRIHIDRCQLLSTGQLTVDRRRHVRWLLLALVLSFTRSSPASRSRETHPAYLRCYLLQLRVSC